MNDNDSTKLELNIVRDDNKMTKLNEEENLKRST